MLVGSDRKLESRIALTVSIFDDNISYPTAKNDTDLACAFADFFMQKIHRLRSETERSATELTTISETVQCLCGEIKLHLLNHLQITRLEQLSRVHLTRFLLQS